jgi:hypothetical protein
LDGHASLERDRPRVADESPPGGDKLIANGRFLRQKFGPRALDLDAGSAPK